MSKQYLFLLGNTPALSRAELDAMLPGITRLPVLESVDCVELDAVAPDLIEVLGGTVKIMEVHGFFTDHSPEQLQEEMTTQLELMGSPDFSVAEVGRDHLPMIEAAEIKYELKKRGNKSRYLEGSRHGLSAAVLRHKKVTELVLIQTEEGVYLAKTIQVQDVDEWSKRDRQKPYADRKKGMLPPKVARMMVNCALGPNPDPDSYLFDPFCGSGTVLMEALCRGVKVIGSDVDPASVAGSQQNLNWLKAEYGLSQDATVIFGDATRVAFPNGQEIQYLVTEPFLGKQTPKLDQLPNIYKGLYKLYLGAFRHWRNLLLDQAKLVVILPVVLPSSDTRGKQFDLDVLIDKLPQFGYTTESESVMYFRPQAVVARQIHHLKFTK